ncbi:ABC transporter permease [Natranaeroarchaeum sulfidigenes]|uniref:ABC-type multidrug transport system, permease component n=1 Tax=Natranaeroarchaeum sulfidigenes TaxID=2784880 RepID=A0A897MU56_9EURY|nr:ABC transporter permease [Natranaeroarchaeum sulfidigenes]QSG01755.1 ABC-type multidrug transport system, permease component [Natranaeroarchaeum sulfidigenes]
MSTLTRIRSEFHASWHSFLRRRTAVFFTFFFPVLLIVIFGALVRTDPGGGGLFTEPAEYYVPGYVAVVVLFTPLSRVGSTVARHRDGNRFEKLATTPLSKTEWLAAHTLVNVVIIGIASLLVLVLVAVLTGAALPLSPLLVPFIIAGVVLFCGVGAMLGSYTESQDGAIAASNSIGLPLLFLSDTFVPPDLLPEWFAPLMELSPLTYFARGVRALSTGGDPLADLVVLSVLAVVFFALGAYSLPQAD